MEQKNRVQKYLEGFRSGDPEKVLECLSEDVIWRLHGCNTYRGKAAFSAEITNEEFKDAPILEIREMIEESDRVVAIGSGSTVGRECRKFSFCEIFVFKGECIKEIDTFHIWLS